MDHEELQQLLDRQSEARQWDGAIDTIEKFVALEPDAFRRGAYLHAAALLASDELRAYDRAIGYATSALDNFFEDPAKLDEAALRRALHSFDVIVRVHTQRRDAEGLDRAYSEVTARLDRANAPRFQAALAKLVDSRVPLKPAPPTMKIAVIAAIAAILLIAGAAAAAIAMR
jgi:tetratricopeptide (TPR) repeat protein